MGAIARLKEHPKGFWFVFWGELAERASYYGMRTILALYLIDILRFDKSSGASVVQFFMADCVLHAPFGWLSGRPVAGPLQDHPLLLDPLRRRSPGPGRRADAVGHVHRPRPAGAGRRVHQAEHLDPAGSDLRPREQAGPHDRGLQLLLRGHQHRRGPDQLHPALGPRRLGIRPGPHGPGHPHGGGLPGLRGRQTPLPARERPQAPQEDSRAASRGVADPQAPGRGVRSHRGVLVRLRPERDHLDLLRPRPPGPDPAAPLLDHPQGHPDSGPAPVVQPVLHRGSHAHLQRPVAVPEEAPGRASGARHPQDAGRVRHRRGLRRHHVTGRVPGRIRARDRVVRGDRRSSS